MEGITEENLRYDYRKVHDLIINCFDFNIYVPSFLLEMEYTPLENKSELDKIFFWNDENVRFCTKPTVVLKEFIDLPDDFSLLFPFETTPLISITNNKEDFYYLIAYTKNFETYTKEVFEQLFISSLIKNDAVSILEYHFNDAPNPKDFLSNVEWLISRNFSNSFENYENLKKVVVISQWIDEKRKELDFLLSTYGRINLSTLDRSFFAKEPIEISKFNYRILIPNFLLEGVAYLSDDEKKGLDKEFLLGFELYGFNRKTAIIDGLLLDKIYREINNRLYLIFPFQHNLTEYSTNDYHVYLYPETYYKQEVFDNLFIEKLKELPNGLTTDFIEFQFSKVENPLGFINYVDELMDSKTNEFKDYKSLKILKTIKDWLNLKNSELNPLLNSNNNVSYSSDFISTICYDYKVIVPSFIIQHDSFSNILNSRNELDIMFLTKNYTFVKESVLVIKTALNFILGINQDDFLTDTMEFSLTFPFNYHFNHSIKEYDKFGNDYDLEVNRVFLNSKEYYSKGNFDLLFITKIKTLKLDSIKKLLDFQLDGNPKPIDFVENLKTILEKYKSDLKDINSQRKLVIIKKWITEREIELHSINSVLDGKTQHIQLSKTNSNPMKLRFRNKKGDRKALYHVFRELSVRDIIPKNDWEHIAEFIIQNIESFEKDNIEYIAKELSRYGYDTPKEKNRINLNEFDID